MTDDKHKALADLLPCPRPWCSKSAPALMRGGFRNLTSRVQCKTCGTHGPEFGDLAGGDSAAITAWNTRDNMLAIIEQRAEIERLRAQDTYAAFQQRRGMLADKVDWAIEEYHQFMMDDAYDAQRVLDRIIDGLRETRAALNPTGEPA